MDDKEIKIILENAKTIAMIGISSETVSYTHLRAHETV